MIDWILWFPAFVLTWVWRVLSFTLHTTLLILFGVPLLVFGSWQLCKKLVPRYKDKILALVNSFLPLPAQIEDLRLSDVSFSFLLLGVRIRGLEIDLRAHKLEDWNWRDEKNSERFESAKDGARNSRLALADQWFKVVESKMKQLETAGKEPETVKAPETNTAAAKPSGSSSKLFDFIGVIVCKVVERFVISVEDVAISIKWENFSMHSTEVSSLEISMPKFSLGKALVDKSLAVPQLRKPIAIQGLHIVLKPHQQVSSSSLNCYYLIQPLDIDIQVNIPLLSMIKEALTSAPPASDTQPVSKTVSVSVDIPNFGIEISPLQLVSLLRFLELLGRHGNFATKAKRVDEATCRQQSLTIEEQEQYVALYRQQIDVEKSRGTVAKLVALVKGAPKTDETEKITLFESRMLSRDILRKRLESAGFDIPSAGEKLPFVSDEEKRETDLDRFMSEPIENYVAQARSEETLDVQQPDKNTSGGLLDGIGFSFRMQNFAVVVNRDDQQGNESEPPKAQVAVFFLKDTVLDATYSLNVKKNQSDLIAVKLAVHRVAFHDSRNLDCNVFTSLVDRNPDCNEAVCVTINSTLRENEEVAGLDVQATISDTSILLIVEPLLSIAKSFQDRLWVMENDNMELGQKGLRGVLSEFEKEMDRIEDEEENARVQADQRSAVIYVSDIPAPYNPMLVEPVLASILPQLRGTEVKVSLTGCELCLLGNPASKDSHVLAFTGDMILTAKTSDSPAVVVDKKTGGTSFMKYESVTLVLEDVALQPCQVVVEDECINLEISGLRTILELEGDGVDFQLQYDLQVPNQLIEKQIVSKKGQDTSNDDQSIEGNRTADSAKNRWNKLRAVVDAPNSIQLHESNERSVTEGSNLEDVAHFQSKFHCCLRNLEVMVSDFALNLSKDDLGVLMNIMNSVNAVQKEDQELVKGREQAQRLRESRVREAVERIYMDKLTHEFKRLDVDNGGSLDGDEVEVLIGNVLSDKRLTKDEFKATVLAFMRLVDEDGSNDISLDEFKAALNPKAVHFETLHHGIVHLTAQEYNNPKFKRSYVPYLTPNDLSKVNELNVFWKTYCDQTGCSKTSLNNQSPRIVQSKMIRIFQNFEYAQEAWRRIVNPSLQHPIERSAWLIGRCEIVEGRSNNITEELIRTIKSPNVGAGSLSKNNSISAFVRGNKIRTVLNTSFGGVYIRIIDTLLPANTPSLEVAIEDISFDGEYCAMEGGQLDSNIDLGGGRSYAGQNQLKPFGKAEFGFTIFGKYFNSHVRDIEPFLEPYQGNLEAVQQRNGKVVMNYSSDTYMHLNVTSALMDTIQSNVASFSSVSSEAGKKKERKHIQEHKGGLFYLNNRLGVDLKYWLVTLREVEEVSGDSESSNSVQASSHKRVDEDVSKPHSVSDEDFHACILEDEEQVLEEQLSLNKKEKELRQAFRNADADGSGELAGEELYPILEEFYKDEMSEDASGEQMKAKVALFMSLADTDGSGEISWEEFKAAMAKLRPSVKRTLCVEIDGYDPVQNIPIDVLGSTFVYELMPKTQYVLDKQTSVQELYERAKSLFLQQNPSLEDVMQAKSLFLQVKKRLNHPYTSQRSNSTVSNGTTSFASVVSNVEWVDSYLNEINNNYSPLLITVKFLVDGNNGMVVRVASALQILNQTEKETEVLMLPSDTIPQTVHDTSIKRVNGKESLIVPLKLVESGFFTIRQIGEVEWSNCLQLTYQNQYIEKRKKRTQDKLVQLKSKSKSSKNKAISKQSDRQSITSSYAGADGSERSSVVADVASRKSISTSSTLDSKMDPNNGSEFEEKGKEKEKHTYTTRDTIDGQPTSVIEEKALTTQKVQQHESSSHNESCPTTVCVSEISSLWSIAIHPQFEFRNVLPCCIAYEIVQLDDVPDQDPTTSGKFMDQIKKLRTGTCLEGFNNGLDEWFNHVDQVNNRVGVLSSGEKVEISGLNLHQTALMRVRAMPNGTTKNDNCDNVDSSDDSFAVKTVLWSRAFVVHLHHDQSNFRNNMYSISIPMQQLVAGQDNDVMLGHKAHKTSSQELSVRFQQRWEDGSFRSLSIFVPFWVLNKSGLSLKYKVAHKEKPNWYIANQTKSQVAVSQKPSTLLEEDEHNRFFHSDTHHVPSSSITPLMVNVMDHKAKLSVLPTESSETVLFSDHWIMREFGSNSDDEQPDSSRKVVKKYPTFSECNWSNGIDINTLNISGEICPPEKSFVLSYKVEVAPAQFNMTKIVSIYPCYIVQNLSIGRTLQVANVHCSRKHGELQLSSKLQKVSDKNSICFLESGNTLIVYAFDGNVNKEFGIRVRDIVAKENKDIFRVQVSKTNGSDYPSGHLLSTIDPGPWSCLLPWKEDDISVQQWSRGCLSSEGPLFQFSITKKDQSSFCIIQDCSRKPAYRIENRSTRYALRYCQLGISASKSTDTMSSNSSGPLSRVEEMILPPLCSHSFSWEKPLMPNPLLKIFAGKNRKPITIDIQEVGSLGELCAVSNTMRTGTDGTESFVYGEVFIDGPSRVLAFGDTQTMRLEREKEEKRSVGAISSIELLQSIDIDITLHGFGITVVDKTPMEVMNITAEKIKLYSPFESNKIEFSVHHFQVDDMLQSSTYPVVFSPVDTGFYSNKREDFVEGKSSEVPFFKFAIDIHPGLQEGITILNDFSLAIGSMSLKLNLDYLLNLLDVFMKFIPPADESKLLEAGLESKNEKLESFVSLPPTGIDGSDLMYFNRWLLEGFDLHLIFDSNPDESGSGISNILGDAIGSIIGGIAHVSPDFKFKTIVYHNSFFHQQELLYKVIYTFVGTVLKQWYQVVFSLELFGDPAGLASDIKDGLALAVRQTKRDFKGESQKKGRGAATLLQAVVGAPAGAIGKVSNGMGDVLKKATYFEDQEEDEEPKHFGSGLVQGGMVFGKSIAYGVSGLVTKPIQGAKEDGVKGFGKGIGKGAVRFVASSFVGTLGAVEKLSQSIHNTTHLMDPVYFEGTRRPARELTHDSLKSLSDSNVITEMEVHIMQGRNLVNPKSSKAHGSHPSGGNFKTYVRLYQIEDNVSGERKEVGRFKTTTKRHSVHPEWDESHLFDVKSINTVMEIELYQKRSPLPKKLIGRVEYSMQELFSMFKAIPVDALCDARTRDHLKTTKRHRGSVLYSHIVNRKIRKKRKKAAVRTARSKSNATEGGYHSTSFIQEEDGDEDLKAQSVDLEVEGGDGDFEDIYIPPQQPKTVTFNDGADLTFNVVYVNDMRR